MSDEETDMSETVPREVYWPGPWHFVEAFLNEPQMWGVNGVPRLVKSGDIIAFQLTDSAMHFVSQDRAIDLGVWNSREELDEAIAEHMRRQIAAQAEAAADSEPERKRRGRPPKQREAQQ